MNLVSIVEKVPQRTIIVTLVCLFALTHAWALLSFDALYWDDWSILTSDSVEIRRMFKFVGFELAGTINAFLASLGAGAYKILMLAGLAVMSASVFFIAQSYRLTRLQAGLITALFIVAPLNTSKIAAVNVLALVFAAVFFLAWLLLIRDLQKPSLLQRLCILALFSLSFYLPSSLAFFALPGMSIAWHAYHSSTVWRERTGVLFRRADFLILPFVQFAIFRLYFFKPHASIANEYQKFGIRPSRLQEALERLHTDIVIDMPWAVRIVLLLLPLLITIRLVRNPPESQAESVKRADTGMLTGLCACFFALLPYLAVGRLPVFSDWNSRYHLFLPLGYALICCSMCLYLASYAKRQWLGVSTYVILLLTSAGFSVLSYFDYADDWRKQSQLMSAMQAQTFIKPTDNIVFVDSVVYAKRRYLRYNEYTQMMRRVQPAWNGLALSEAQLQSVGGGSLTRYVQLLGGIDNIQADPILFGFANGWRWNNSCIVLVISEDKGQVKLRRANNMATVQQPCVLSSAQTYQ
jgi:hypothetical protein